MEDLDTASDEQVLLGNSIQAISEHPLFARHYARSQEFGEENLAQ